MDLQETVRRYKHKYPYTSHQGLARIIVKEENLKISPRTLRRKIPEMIQKANDSFVEAVLNDIDFELPVSIYEERKPFIIPSSYDNILVIGDIHIPFQSNPSLKLTLNYARDRHVNAIILNGDIIDFYAISRFGRRPDLRDAQLEVKRTKEFFAVLRKLFPSIPIYYKLGNHEERWIHYIAEKAPELWNVPGIKFEQLLDFATYDITLVDNQRVIEAGLLNIVHGHEFKMFSGGVNVARAARLKAIDNVLTNHFHQWSDNAAPDIRGKVQGGFSVGCQCGLSPDYMPINNWVHGFAIVETESSGLFNVDNKKIINGQIK